MSYLKTLFRFYLISTFAFFCVLEGQAEEVQVPTTSDIYCGQGAIEGSHDAEIFSMMGWGLGLATGIAVLSVLFETSTTHAHSH